MGSTFAEGMARHEQPLGSSDALKTRLDFAVATGRKMKTNFEVQQRAADMLGASLDRDTEVAISRAADQSQALALLLMSPEFQKR